MEPSPDFLLPLLAVRLNGPNADPKIGVLKSLKKELADAKNEGLIEDKETEITVQNKAGKPTKKKLKIVALTASGEQLLSRGQDPAFVATAQACQFALMQQALEADRASLKQSILDAAAAKKPTKDTRGPDLAEIAKAVQKIAERLERLEQAAPQDTSNPLLAKVDEGFAALTARIAQVGEQKGPGTK